MFCCCYCCWSVCLSLYGLNMFSGYVFYGHVECMEGNMWTRGGLVIELNEGDLNVNLFLTQVADSFLM